MMASARHTVVALMQDHPGVLNRVASMFRRRVFNIESLTVGHTDQAGISRMTIVLDGAVTDVKQVILQLNKLIEVIKLNEITNEPSISHELALIKVTATGATRAEVLQIAGVFHASVVDVAADSVMVQVAGSGENVDSLVELLRTYGIREMVRTGAVAMTRGSSSLVVDS